MLVTTKLYINNTDALATWGVQLDEGGLDALQEFPPNKEPVTNKNVTGEGAVVVCGTGLIDERTINVPIHITANSYTDFKTKRSAFYTAIKGGALNIVVKREWKTKVSGVVKTTEEQEFASTMYYIDCQQFTQYTVPQRKTYSNNTWSDVAGSGYGVAKFILILYEPNTPPVASEED
jgi:hypothetical protein